MHADAVVLSCHVTCNVPFLGCLLSFKSERLCLLTQVFPTDKVLRYDVCFRGLRSINSVEM